LDDALGRYIEFVKNSFPRGLRLDGLKIVVDCANGAAYRVAPTVFYELGAEVVPLAVEPDGFNINKDCGATAPGKLCQAVLDHGADLGVALDGDADRMVMADENGRLVDGDQILGLIARSWRESEVLRGGGIVGTVMANLGLERYLAGLGLDLRRTPVGDRYVVERMREGGYNLGGEQSGHIVLSDYSTTGDGLIAALQVLAVLVQDGGKASQVTRVFEPLPQVLKNVPLGGGTAPETALEDAAVRAAVAAGERALGRGGRLLIRKSGTEPVVRVMGEGEDAKAVGDVVETIARTIAKAAG
jgi:phosphoglucosamine mutase